MKNIGLYIHIPFCIKKCNYCDFNSVTTLDFIPEYLISLKKEISSLKDCGYRAETVYIGGGTPTILNCWQLSSLFECLHKNIDIATNAEITIEANPETLNKEKLLLLKTLGINRLSLGLQAYEDRLLEIMGRIHTVKEFEIGFKAARDVGFDNINVDLIFGLPGQSLKDFIYGLNQLLVFSPEHISCYALSVEIGTEFHKRKRSGKLPLPTEKDERLMYYKAIEVLTCHDYKHYEISNFALVNKESRHNLVYWTYKDYLGIGAGSHSFVDNKRFNNYPSIPVYIKSIAEFHNAIEQAKTISIDEQQAEFCFLGLRLLDGLDKQAFYRRFNKKITQTHGNAIEKLKKQGLLQENPKGIKLTTRGLDFANTVFVEFLP